jgi:hypothetical protein
MEMSQPVVWKIHERRKALPDAGLPPYDKAVAHEPNQSLGRKKGRSNDYDHG